MQRALERPADGGALMIGRGTVVRVNSTDVMTLGFFFDENRDGIDSEQQTAIRIALDLDGLYEGGGGAAPEWSLEVEPVQPAMTSHSESRAEQRALSQCAALGAHQRATQALRSRLAHEARAKVRDGMPHAWAAVWLKRQVDVLDAPFFEKWSMGGQS